MTLTRYQSRVSSRNPWMFCFGGDTFFPCRTHSIHENVHTSLHLVSIPDRLRSVNQIGRTPYEFLFPANTTCKHLLNDMLCSLPALGHTAYRSAWSRCSSRSSSRSTWRS